ncbi:MAG: hypothetical protein GXY99_04095 [Clostridiaceae bacterium]|jgi:DNA replication protein DnaC|nr:hypothetical protein [Clostridiaceae bacterium]
MSKALIAELCRQLRLETYIADSYAKVEAESHEDFLIKLLTEAVASRNNERRKRYIRQAGFVLAKHTEMARP